MYLLNELVEWLDSSRQFLRKHGPDILGLDPAHEKILVNRYLLGGVLIYPGVGHPIELGGMKGHKRSKASEPEYPATVDPYAIVHDQPGQSVDMAIDWLAMSRVWRSLGPGHEMPEWYRVSTALLTALRHIGVPPEELYSTLAMLGGSTVGYTGLRWRDNTDPTDQIPFVIYSNMSRTLNAEVLWFRGLGDEANIDLKRLPGKAGNRYGRFYIPGSIPENVMSTSSGLPMKDVISCYVTDPHDLRICYMRPLIDKTLVLFEGADQLTRCVPVFRYQEMAERFAEEVGKLAEARAIMRKQLSTSALSDEWWDAFEAYVESGAARPFKPRYIRYGAKVWMPADPMRELLATGR